MKSIRGFTISINKDSLTPSVKAELLTTEGLLTYFEVPVARPLTEEREKKLAKLARDFVAEALEFDESKGVVLDPEDIKELINRVLPSLFQYPAPDISTIKTEELERRIVERVAKMTDREIADVERILGFKTPASPTGRTTSREPALQNIPVRGPKHKHWTVGQTLLAEILGDAYKG